MIIDATNMVMGRLAAKAAKQALNGEKVIIVNCEKAVITGNRKTILADYVDRHQLGQVNQGPYFQRRPEKLLRRAIRGMLPRKKPSGRTAFERVICHVGMPAGVKAEEAKGIPEANITKVSKAAHMTLGELCRHLGYKESQLVKK